MNGAKFESSAFTNCKFNGTRLLATSFTNCKLVGSAFLSCEHGLMTAKGGDWSFVGLRGADLRSATFTDLRMRDADLAASQCDGAKFIGVDLIGANLHSVTFIGADLRGSAFSHLDSRAAKGAIIDPDQAVTLAQSVGATVAWPNQELD